MISKVRPSFWRAYGQLSPLVKARAKTSWQLFEKNRAVGVRSGEVIEWIWIGTHNEFDNLFS